MLTVTVSDEGADFWIVMRGRKDRVGTVKTGFRQGYIGVRDSNKENLSLIKDWMDTIYNDGYWERRLRDSSARIVSLKLSEVRKVIDQLDLKQPRKNNV